MTTPTILESKRKYYDKYMDFANEFIDWNSPSHFETGVKPDDVWNWHQEKMREMLERVRKEVVGKVKFYRCKDTDSIDFGKKIPAEYADIEKQRQKLDQMINDLDRK